MSKNSNITTIKSKKNVIIKDEVNTEDIQITVEEQYKKKTLHQHILDRPGMYIGPIRSDKVNMYVYNDEISGIIRKDIVVVLGLYKIFDEILVNAADHCVRDTKCNRIDVNIDQEEGTIQVKNNGTSVPIEFHKDEQMYVPEMIFGTLLTSGNYNDNEERVVGGTNGIGSKCILSSTKIIKYNGLETIAKNIKIGDELIGDDGKPRTVLRTIEGNGQMYEIIQASGESYTVNDNHTLTLHMPDHKVIFWNNNGWTMLWWNHKEQCINSKFIKAQVIKEKCNECGIEISSRMKRHYERLHKDKEVPKKERKSPTINPEETEEIKKAKLEMEEFAKTIPDNNVIDINIQDYMKLNETSQKRLAGIRGDCIQWKKQEVELDPYVLGLWLGDGMQSGYRYACDGDNDTEIINYLTEWGINNDAVIKKSTQKYIYDITSRDNFRKKGFAPLKKHLELYNLINNKHIPIDYIVNDRETRLKVLAGIIDTDGTVQRDGKRITITQGFNHEQLAKDIVILARSLGFYTCFTIKNTTWYHKDEKKTGQAYNINISGDIKDIPTLLPRNKCSSERHDSIKTTGYLTIKDAGIGNYVGFELDGNQRFVINDFTVTHNCTNVYSDWFDVEIQDTIRHKKYYQRFKKNMYEREKPIISDIPKTVTDSYTKITFLPDYKRFGLNNLTDDNLSLFKRRVYDVAGTTKSNVKVYYNGEYIDIKTFEDYIKLYYSDKDEEELNIIYQDFNERWSIGVVYDPTNEFRHMTFVNKISTYDGGTHLNYIMGQIVDKVTTSIISQPKYKSLKIKPTQIKENITVFINSTIENPVFGSQTKDSLKTKISDFKIKCEIDDKFIAKICKSGLLEEIVQVSQIKQLAELEKTDGKKVTSLKNLVKLEDARFAGTKQAHKCTLILTEGDSAKKFAIDAFEVIGRDYFGVFPLKGKLLNVREATASQLLSNEEIKNLKQIIGLQNKKTHSDIKDLRYGHMLILTDQDSVSADTSLLLKNTDNKYEIKTIDDISSDWILEPSGKETSLTDFKIWTEKGWTKIVKVIRHKVTKKMYRVLTHTGVVDVTEDHSLLKPNGDEISPKDCIIDQELLHSFPKFEELKINIPDDLENIKLRDLWEICKELKIQYYQNYKKDDLIKMLNDYKKNSIYIGLGTDNTIDRDEAYVMGLFFADGSCNINKWIYKYKQANRPNEYAINRTSYCWNISNSNMEYLNKAINILRTKYQFEFKIIDDRHNHDALGGCNMYKIIINGGEKTKPIIDKYRKLFYDKDAKKRIPLEILNASYEVRENFFIGYYDGNGCKASHVGAKYFDVDGKIGSHGLFFLCKSLGYEVSINTQERKPKVYTLNITKGTQQHHPNTIKKIIELEDKEQYVYDLETENHHFQAGVGQMIVHNTDGSHIKGLLINFIHTFWPNLAKVDGFIQSIATPIVKIFKKGDSKKNALYTFYTMTEYKNWCEKIGESIKSYDIKYYKGLGTSTDKEAKEAFTDYANKIIDYVWNKKSQNQKAGNPKIAIEDGEIEDEKEQSLKEVDISETSSVSTDLNDKNEASYQAITLAFAKKRANDRKQWLKEYDPNKIIENTNKSVSFDEFVELDLKHFSNSDNIRSIPDISDGFKPSQRKIAFGAIKRKLERDEIKVAQLSGYISEHTGYHHGETSLQGAIINMAQDFCGSNNINIFKPNGNFGSRRVGGKDAASSRYIFTQLNKLTKLIFNDKDEPVLEYNEEEGDKVEPKIYYPIIPMILVNGTSGIGTGYSTDIPQYNPLDLIKNIRDYLKGKSVDELDELIPWYRGFAGRIEKKPKNNSKDKEAYNVYGVATIINENTIRIKELPIGVWTEPYLQFLESQREEGTFITDYINNSSNHKIDIEVIFANGQLQHLIKNNLIFSRLKLIGSISIENMHLYKDNVITKYKTANAILKDYINIRLEAYNIRKKCMIKILNNEMQILKYRKQYIEDILDKKIIVERVTRAKLVQQFIENEYPELSININNNTSYDYLLSLPITSLTTEKIDDINKEYKEKKDELDTYKNTSIQNLWLGELDEFEKAYEKWLAEMEELTSDSVVKKEKVKASKTVKKVEKKVEKQEPKLKVVKKTK